ncbi:FG-GAP-like repeat-containing protein [Paenibacillus sp. UNC499MF]|uniref:FG-GAP-like repeat-containing protein n=1 Tax=Paenibacillus sp. UNC499MF TaxID=1502751 RepID=UPI0008A050FA|nr:FG-GAP-like repeat-containing protein [Paenibacillus sp. UNC499MF]SEG75872.1 FG-GAP repeat-containing protein [Paenibacillus sp. UNC499MF]
MIRSAKKGQAQKWLALVLGAALIAVPVGPVKANGVNPVFENAVAYEVGGWAYDVKTGDVNGDGLDDLVSLNFQNNQVAVLLGKGDGTFGASAAFAVGRNPRAVAIADLDGDHRADLAVANSQDNTVSILKGSGDGTFLPWGNVTGVGAEPLEIAVSDLNGDGYPDLAVVNNSSGSVSILFNVGGSGNFVLGASIPVLAYPRSLAAWDMDGDGKTDLAVANSGSNTVSILKNDGTGTQFSRVDYAAGSSPNKMKAADLNGDGLKDMVFAANGDNGVTVLLGTAGGGFGQAVLYPAGNLPLDVALGDFDGDGHIDILGQTQGQDFAILMGNGDGTFQSPISYPYPRYAFYLETGEFNGDGRSDIVLASSSPSNTSVNVMNSRAEGAFSLASNTFETAENNGTVSVTIKRTGSGTGQTAVRIRTTDGTAVAGKDYAVVDEVVVLQDGETSRDYPVTVMDNQGYEGDKTFTVKLSDPANGYVMGAPDEAVVTIREDDALPDTTPPTVDVSKFGVIDSYAGTQDRLYGAAGAVGEAGAAVKAYSWTDTDKDGIVGTGELGMPAVLGSSAGDGSVSAADIGDLAPGSYAYVITATDTAGNESAKSAVAALTVTLAKGASPDTEAPVWPAGAAPAFSGVTTSGVNVSWPEAADNRAVAGYDVYRNGTLLTTVSADTYSYRAAGLTSDTLYSFAVKAKDGAGNASVELAGTVRTLAVPVSGGSSGSSPSLSAESRLQELHFTAGKKEAALTPSFQPGVSDYAVETDADRGVIRYKTMDSAARAGVNGQTAGSTGGEYAASLSEGVNVFKIAVQAEDGSTREYKLTVTRKAAEGGTNPGTKPDAGSGTGPGTPPGPGTKPEPGGSRFADVSGHWAETDIGRAIALGLVDGYEDGTFHPDATINRAEWVVMLERLLNGAKAAGGTSTDAASKTSVGSAAETVEKATAAIAVSASANAAETALGSDSEAEAKIPAATAARIAKESATNTAPLSFADGGAIPAWAARAVADASAKGIVSGYEDGTFRPGAAVTRAELAVMLAKAVNGSAAGGGKAAAFTDEADIPAWARPYVQEAAERGLIDGRSGNRFAPNEKATRAEAAVLLVRLAKLLGL